ncbi:CobW family GTP-binding protein [Nocardiopsis suaedae]|uniref:GTP-binding protein n=1 Tax=Nocardiopsis suaedae TaxID=3018444 RepID=A0ABT4THN9_9ACTN|nr:GTP-binding protein [Nocardiopsis suaedae]MDA2804223.1 GTP-binding protein [Nocardiopsis suaedae]
MTASPKIPVTVLAGFLGSGKTTLVNRILTADHGARIAVVENEFGEIPIDDALVLTGDEEIIEMSNGCCLCCTARTDLIDILHRLLERPERFDRVLIETSGMADPDPVAQTFFVDEEIAAAFELDGVVTMVDALHARAHLDGAAGEGGEGGGVGTRVTDQIAFADRVVLNKTDLVSPEEADAVEERIRGVNATADVIRARYADIDVAGVLAIGAFGGAGRVAGAPDAMDGWDEGAHLHDPTLDSVSVEVEEEVDADAVREWAEDFLRERGPDVYRIKGLLAVGGDPRRFVLQGVHTLFEITPGTPWNGERRSTRVVVIGRDLPSREELGRALRFCSPAQAGGRTPARASIPASSSAMP